MKNYNELSIALLLVIVGSTLGVAAHVNADEPNQATDVWTSQRVDRNQPNFFELVEQNKRADESSEIEPYVALGIFNELPPEPTGDNEWSSSITPYFYLPGLEGDATIAGVTAELDLDFSDLLDNFDIFGMSARVEAWKNDQWGIILDGMYLDVDGVFKAPGPGPRNIHVEITQWQVDLGLGLKLLDRPLGDEEASSKNLRIDLLGGGRYQYFREELRIGILPKLGADQDWVEPFIGGRAILKLTDKYSFQVRGDASGFGIGSASELTWNLVAGLGIDFSPKTRMHVGYKVQGFDYSHGSGASNFGGDWTTQGVGLSMSFLF